MKKLFITIGVSFVFIVATSVQSSAENLIYGCYKKQNGQLRIVSNPSECRPSEVPISWNQAGEQVPPEPQGLTGVPEKNIYDQAYELFRQEKYDEVISSLVGYCASNPQDIKSQILLAKAYLEKCDLLKEQGSLQYRTLVYKPFEIGKKIILPRDQYLSEGLYICGRSYIINRRANRASRYIKKAIKFSMSPPAEYFIALGDAQFAEGINEDPTGSEREYYWSAENTYKRVFNMEIENNEKGKAYYKLGVLHLFLNEKKDAKQAFESALKFAEKESLISRIHNNMEPRK